MDTTLILLIITFVLSFCLLIASTIYLISVIKQYRKLNSKLHKN